MLTAIILAAGGRRPSLRPPPRPLSVEPPLARQVRLIRECDRDAEILIVANPGSERAAREAGTTATLIANPEAAHTGSAWSLALAVERSSPTSLLIIPGDLAFNKQAVAGMMGGWSKLNVAAPGQIDAAKVGVAAQDDRVLALDYLLPEKWGQMALLVGAELDLLRGELEQPETRSHHYWQTLNNTIAHGGQFAPHQSSRARLVELDSIPNYHLYFSWYQNAPTRTSSRRSAPASSRSGSGAAGRSPGEASAPPRIPHR